MSDCLSLLKSLKRPALLIRAARLGKADYQRERDLRRILKSTRLPGPREAVLRLLEEESKLNEDRHRGNSLYSLGHHVDVMIALLAEASALRAI